MTDKQRIAELEKEKQKLLESVEGATAMYKDLQEARMRIAELEAGRPKWHKVADGDLPPVRMVVFVSGYLGDMKDLHGFDEWDGEKWLNEDMPGFVRVAWCEIPKYIEK